jgi:hypothetical protein
MVGDEKMKKTKQKKMTQNKYAERLMQELFDLTLGYNKNISKALIVGCLMSTMHYLLSEAYTEFMELK